MQLVVWEVSVGADAEFGYTRAATVTSITVDRLNVTKYSYNRILCSLIHTRCILSDKNLQTFSSCENIQWPYTHKVTHVRTQV